MRLQQHGHMRLKIHPAQQGHKVKTMMKKLMLKLKLVNFMATMMSPKLVKSVQG